MFYDNVAFLHKRTKVGMLLERMQSRTLLRRLAAYVPAGAKMLELGPGFGTFADCAVEAGYAYSAIDGNKSFVEQLRARGIEATQAMFPPVCAPAESVDCIVAKHVIEHMPSWREAGEVLRSGSECLRPRGIVAILAPDANACRAHFWDADYSHTFPTTVINLRRLFVDYGFEVLEVCYTSGPFFGWTRLPFILLNKANPARWINSIVPPGVPPSKLYKLWMTFLQSILLIARKPPQPVS